MANTSERGNDFRELVGQILRAAGFYTASEVRISDKHVDLEGRYCRDDITGPVRFAFEVKDHAGTLKASECRSFVYDHQRLILDGTIDQAWLVSKGLISPAGRQAVEAAGRGLQIMTFAELQRRLLVLEPYLRLLVADYDKRKLDRFYIRPETSVGADLEAQVRSWLAESNPPPLFVFGQYGKGKSTFATHLAASLAGEALGDPAGRVPILVRLGEIADEQSIDGLLGKVLASQYRVANYHFDTFRALNEAGRFLIIYDGFDEMKHGLTPAKFQQVFKELMRLDEGDARILVLGRDTAFHDETEFRAVIDGVEITAAGREIPAPGRRPYRHTDIRGFTKDEARDYVRRFLPVLAEGEGSGPATDPAWVSVRVEELVSGQYDDLLERPVHAQMLCEIAIHPEQLRKGMSVYELFDSFIHYLLARELDKKGRDQDFSIEVRRGFNAALAWWLWERGGASTTTLADIPQSLCEEAVAGVSHKLGNQEMRRELIQGCLVEKGAATIYFHRSIQEFLVAEHLIATDLLQRGPGGANWLAGATGGATPEVIDFVVAGANVTPERRKRALQWLSALPAARADRVSFGGFELITAICRSLNAKIARPAEAPWFLWLSYFLRADVRDFVPRNRSFEVLADALIEARSAEQDVQAAALYLAARLLFHGTQGHTASVGLAIAAMIPAKRLASAVAAASEKKSERQIIRHDEDFILWALLRALRVETGEDDTLVAIIDVAKLHHDVLGLVPGGFADDKEATLKDFRFPVQSIYVGMRNLQPEVNERTIDAIRPFFNDPNLRKLIAPVQIDYRPSISVPRPAEPRPRKPLLQPKAE